MAVVPLPHWHLDVDDPREILNLFCLGNPSLQSFDEDHGDCEEPTPAGQRTDCSGIRRGLDYAACSMPTAVPVVSAALVATPGHADSVAVDLGSDTVVEMRN